MEKSLYTVMACLCSQAALAQISITSQASYGGSDYEWITPGGFKKLPDNSFVCSIRSASPVSGVKTAAFYGETDGWVVRITANGTEMWQQSYGGSLDEYGFAAQAFPDALYLGFSSLSPVSGNKTLPDYGTGPDLGDYWLLKTDLQGGILWQRIYGTDKMDLLKDIAEMPGNRLVLAGNTTGGVSIDKTEPARGDEDFWLIAMDSSGNKIWDKTLDMCRVVLPENEKYA